MVWPYTSIQTDNRMSAGTIPIPELESELRNNFIGRIGIGVMWDGRPELNNSYWIGIGIEAARTCPSLNRTVSNVAVSAYAKLWNEFASTEFQAVSFNAVHVH